MLLYGLALFYRQNFHALLQTSFISAISSLSVSWQPIKQGIATGFLS
jgi:hypothetical protein